VRKWYHETVYLNLQKGCSLNLLTCDS